MANRQLPSPEELRQLLRYEPETGKLYWRHRPLDMCLNNRYYRAWNARCEGKEAFKAKHPGGYATGTIFGVSHLAHRVIWAIVYGADIPDEVDHRNLNKSDNRINNLRRADKSTNQQNIGKRCNNTSGFKGVSRSSSRGLPWRATIKVEGRQKSLGRFETAEQAHAAYVAASAQYHGEYGRT